jgi:hypothetical protein
MASPPTPPVPPPAPAPKAPDPEIPGLLRKAWRVEYASSGLSSDYLDIVEAEFLFDDRKSTRRGDRVSPHTLDEIRTCYDESQALEVLSVEPGWLHGEKFYQPNAPKFEDEYEDCYVQDFGFGPYLKSPREEVAWRSIIEEDPPPELQRPKLLSEVFGPMPPAVALGMMAVGALLMKDGGAS